jgi:Resolvase, N terminal domain
LPVRAGLYARVAAWDKAPDKQLATLREFAQTRGWAIAEFVDDGVSVTDEERPALSAVGYRAQRRDRRHCVFRARPACRPARRLIRADPRTGKHRGRSRGSGANVARSGGAHVRIRVHSHSDPLRRVRGLRVVSVARKNSECLRQIGPNQKYRQCQSRNRTCCLCVRIIRRVAKWQKRCCAKWAVTDFTSRAPARRRPECIP